MFVSLFTQTSFEHTQPEKNMLLFKCSNELSCNYEYFTMFNIYSRINSY